MLASVLVCSLTGYDDSSGVEPWGITANMVETRWGIAACYGWPFGTIFEIEGLGRFECQDRGGLILNRNQVDVWFPSYEEAIEFGVRKMWCKVYRPVTYLVRPSMRAKRNSLRGEKRERVENTIRFSR